MRKSFNGVIVNSSKASKTVRVAVIMGGGKACIARLLSTSGDIVVYVDNPAEVEAMRVALRSNDVIFAPTGGGQTLHEQLIRAGKPMENPPLNFSFTGGSGAMPEASRLTMEEYLGTADYQKLLQEIEYRARKKAKGEIAELYVCGYGSLAGGKCAGGMPTLLQRLASDLQRIACSVVVVGDFMAAQVFNGVSAVANENAAGVLPTFARFFTESSVDEPAIVKLATFHESPLTDRDEELRHKLIAIEAQAVSSVFFRNQMLLMESNLCALGRTAVPPFKGNILRRRTEYLSIYADEVLVSNIAVLVTNLIEELKDQLSSAVILIDGLEWDIESGQTKTIDCPVDQVLKQSLQLDEETLINSLLSVPRADKHQIGLRLVDETLVDPTVLAHDARSEGYAMGKLVNDYAKLNAARKLLATTYQSFDIAVQECGATIEAKKREVIARRRAIKNRSYRELFAKEAQLMAAFESSCRELRSEAERRELLAEQMEAIRFQFQKCNQTVQFIDGKLNSIARSLKPFTRSESSDKRNHFILEDGDTTLARIWSLPEVDMETQRVILRSCVGALTVEGLAAMFGIKSIDFHDIACEIAFNPPMFSAPSLGGVPDVDYLSVTYMLPRMSAREEEALIAAIKTVAANAEVGFCDVLSAGVAAVRINQAQCNSADDLFRGYLGKELKRAHRGPHADMVAIGGEKALEYFGINIDK
jgi:hypothetical protein